MHNFNLCKIHIIIIFLNNFIKKYKDIPMVKVKKKITVYKYLKIVILNKKRKFKKCNALN